MDAAGRVEVEAAEAEVDGVAEAVAAADGGVQATPLAPVLSEEKVRPQTIGPQTMHRLHWKRLRRLRRSRGRV